MSLLAQKDSLTVSGNLVGADRWFYFNRNPAETVKWWVLVCGVAKLKMFVRKPLAKQIQCLIHLARASDGRYLLFFFVWLESLASLNKISFLLISIVFSPIPETSSKSSSVLNGCFSVLYLIIASAFLSPMPDNASEMVFASAVLMLTGEENALNAQRDNAIIIRRFMFFP